jgi:hypothetical protein
LDLETQTWQRTGTLGTAQIVLDQCPIRTNGFLADLYIEIETNATPNTDNVVAFNEDMPTSAFASIVLNDTGNQPILGPMSGWELGVFVKYGGFRFSDDWRNSQQYAATVGAAAAGGYFHVFLHLPVQFVKREPLGPLPNTNNSNAYTLEITLSTLAQIYATAPDGAPTFTVRVHQDAYRQSSGKDAQKNATVLTPPGLGSTMYFRRNTQALPAGAFDEELTPHEGCYRQLIFVGRAVADGLRATASPLLPDPFTVFFNNDVPYLRTLSNFRRKLEMDFGYVAAAEAVNGIENGLLALHWIGDHGLKAGSEDRYRYLTISAADTLGVRGTAGGALNMTMLHGFVRPPGGNVKGMTAR